MSWSERTRRALGVALLLAGGVTLALLAAELGARVWWEPPRIATPAIAESLRDLPDLRTKVELGQPNLRALNAGALYETNSAGFRGRERTAAPPPGGYRIALIGDSFAMGWGVAEADTYAARLETLLAQQTRAPVEVLNFGLAGLDGVEVVERYHDLALAYDPDLAVYGFTLNDLENLHYRRSAPNLGDVHAVLMASPSYLWRALAPRIGPIVEVLLAPPGTPLYELDDNYFHNPGAWQTLLSALDRFAATQQQRGDCAVLLIHPQLHFLNALHPYQRHYDAIEQAAHERGFFTVRAVDDFLGRKDRELWASAFDAHPGPQAHSLLALRLLRELSALPARCRVPALAADPARG